MKIQSAKQKGKILENWLVERLRLSGLDKRAYRQKGSGSGLLKSDIWTSLNIHFECKNQKKFRSEWFKQVKEENVSNFPSVIIWHLPQTPLEDSKAIVDFWWLEELLKKTKKPPKISEISEPSKELKWRLAKFKQNCQKIIKELE